MRIGILGGNFNPVHNVHLFIADQVQQRLGLDEVQLMPENEPPHVDTKETIAPHHRFNMLSLALADYPNLTINVSEIERGGKSFTFDTMTQLTSQHPENDYFFIIGGDMVDYLEKWYKIDELMNLVTFVAVRRDQSSELKTRYPIQIVDLPILSTSSSYIRDCIATGIAPNFLLPAEVLAYINQHGIYQKNGML